MPQSRLFSNGREYPLAKKDPSLIACALCGDWIYRRNVIWRGEGAEQVKGGTELRPITETPLCPSCDDTVNSQVEDMRKLVLLLERCGKIQRDPYWSDGEKRDRMVSAARIMGLSPDLIP